MQFQLCTPTEHMKILLAMVRLIYVILLFIFLNYYDYDAVLAVRVNSS